MRLWKRRCGRPNPDLKKAQRARVAAQRQLDATRAETPIYRALAESLRELRERNHFAAAIEATFRGGEK